MLVVPAIDLLDGACVRLRQGAYDAAAVYGGNPLAVAREFAKAGAELIHLVDLDGARTGSALQAVLIKRIAAAVPVRCEVGGGVRSMEEIRAYLDGGLDRVILGSAAIEDPGLVRRAIDEYGPRIVLGLDARGGMAATHGWIETSDRPVLDLARQMQGLGVEEVVYTDIARDGMLAGPDLEGLKSLIRGTSLRVVASGGMSSLADLKAAAAAGAVAAIVGKAIYAGWIDLKQAVVELADFQRCRDGFADSR